ncbi:CrcB-like protein-domain-containing protein [Scheffersomyces amazonensis]|uniref:CrcB-like protein-domain-containing protein n=1 Tax=Scheffersomyces amazonensis TaxID=1078765 RepID=UPI00315D159A
MIPEDTTDIEQSNEDMSNDSSMSNRRRNVEDELHELEAASLQESLPEGFNVDETEKGFKRPKYHKIILDKSHKYFPVLLNIVNGAIWGVLARKGLMVLTSYPGSYLPGVLWANFGACIVMGIAVNSSKIWDILLENHPNDYPNKASIPLYTGITTGFCGTFSSFSTVIVEAFNKAANTEIGVYYDYPNAGYGVMEFLAVICIQFGLSGAGFHIGRHLTEVLDEFSPVMTKRNYKIIERLSIIIGAATFIVNCVLIGVLDSWRSWTFAIFFAPFGALLRFYLSKYLNSKVKNFPLGTFTANFVGTLLLGIFNLLARARGINMSLISCHVLMGLDDGFCGALTTVSTFIVELFGLRTLHSYRYGIFSVMGSFIAIVLILGSYNWSVGLTSPICS